MKFLKTLLATTLGTLLALFVIFIIMVVIISSSSGEPEPYISDNSVLKIELSGSLPARSISNPFQEFFNRQNNEQVSLENLKQNLAKAAVHDNIKGVLLEIDFMAEGWANVQEAYQIIKQFRDSTDKFIYATTNDAGYNEQGYYLASATDSVFSPPESFFEFDGFYSQVTFYDGLFEKVGLKTEITRHGKYKGAVEPYFRKNLSKENAYQLKQLIDGVSTTFVDALSKKTGKSTVEINTMLNSTPHLTAQFGRQKGFIDSLLYADQLNDLIKKRIGLQDDDSFDTISSGRYAKVSNTSAGLKKGKSDGTIAIIYASGAIMPGDNDGSAFGTQQLITAPSFKRQLEKATDDDDVKALVIRINSPGGSGSTSDAIWHMIKETGKKMPVIVSMGPVAASGGYYMAMAADTIVAEPTTITGSIGVFGTKFNAKQLFNDEVGITFDEVKSHEHADWLSTTRGFTPSEAKAFQVYIDGFYDTFITKVAASRGLTKQQVDNIGQGRVWSGADAKDQKLVDVIGGMDTALAIAAEKAGFKGYETESYPKAKDLFQMFMGSAETKIKTMVGSSIFGNEEVNKLSRQLSMFKRRDAMLLFPYEISIQ